MSDITDLFSGQDRMAQPRGAAFFVQGTVADNGDKENAGRVKVEFTAWKQGGNICQWMPVLRGYAGGDYGVYCMPEVGDVVLVGFLGTDYSRPFVAGCFYPAGAAMEKECFTDKNTMRRFKTKGGVPPFGRAHPGGERTLFGRGCVRAHCAGAKYGGGACRGGAGDGFLCGDGADG